MLFKRLSPFSLFLILLTAICQNVETNRDETDSNLRRNFIKDVKQFFLRIFNPQPSYKRPIATKPTVNNTRNETIENDIQELLRTNITPSVLLRSKINDFEENSTENRHLKKNPITGNVDIDIDLISMGKSQKTDDNEIKYRKNYVTKKNGFIITENAEKKAKKLIIIVTNQEKVDQTRKTNDNEHLTREGVKKMVLRQTYGKACIKVAVRKCFRALYNVNAIVCKTRYHCKSSFKSTFLLYAKRSCIVEFDHTKKLNKTKHKQALKKRGNNIKRYKRETSDYINDCIPHLVSEYANTVPKIFRNQSNEDVTLILRRRSERKCQKLLRKKCTTACQRAVSRTCSSYICGKSKRKVYKKECRRECTRKYLVNSDSSDSSKSDSSD